MTGADKQIDKSQVRQHFSCHAEEYDRYALVQRKVADELATLLLEQPQQPRSRCLEIGCGTGLLSSRLLRDHPGLSLVLSDLAHGMSRHVQRLFPHCPVCDADAAELPFLSNGFDLVVSSSVYQWLNDLPNAFDEVARLLRAGGLCAIAMFGERTLYELRESHQAALDKGSSHGQSFPDLAKIAAALGDSFEVLQLRSVFECEWHESVPQLLHSLKHIGAQNARHDRPRGLASRQVMQKMVAHYEQNYATAAGLPATYEVIYLLARKRP